MKEKIILIGGVIAFAILLILQMNYFEFYPLKQEIPSILRLCFYY